MKISIQMFLPAACLFVSAVPVQSQPQATRPFAPGIDPRLLAEAGLQIEWSSRDLQSTKDEIAAVAADLDDDTVADIILGLTEDEAFVTCNDELLAFFEEKPELLAATEDYANAATVNPEFQGGKVLIEMEYPESANARLKEACDAAGAYFDHNVGALKCTEPEAILNVKGYSVCVPDTEACRQMDVIVTLRYIFEESGMTCVEVNDDGSVSETTGKPSKWAPIASAGANLHAALAFGASVVVAAAALI